MPRGTGGGRSPARSVAPSRRFFAGAHALAAGEISVNRNAGLGPGLQPLPAVAADRAPRTASQWFLLSPLTSGGDGPWGLWVPAGATDSLATRLPPTNGRGDEGQSSCHQPNPTAVQGSFAGGATACPGADAPRALLQARLQARDRALEAGDGVSLACLPPRREVDDRTHAPMVAPGSDIPVEGHRSGAQPCLRPTGRSGSSLPNLPTPA